MSFEATPSREMISDQGLIETSMQPWNSNNSWTAQEQAPHTASSVKMLILNGLTDQSAMRTLFAFTKRLESLSKLPVNWDGYGGRPMSENSIVGAVRFIQEILQSTTPLPSIVPTSLGNIQLEWHIGDMDIEIECTNERGFDVYCEDLTGILEPIEVRGKQINEQVKKYFDALTSRI